MCVYVCRSHRTRLHLILDNIMISITYNLNYFVQVNSVDPSKVSEEFGNILAEPTIATSVETTFIVHNGL